LGGSAGRLAWLLRAARGHAKVEGAARAHVQTHAYAAQRGAGPADCVSLRVTHAAVPWSSLGDLAGSTGSRQQRAVICPAAQGSAFDRQRQPSSRPPQPPRHPRRAGRAPAPVRPRLRLCSPSITGSAGSANVATPPTAQRTCPCGPRLTLELDAPRARTRARVLARSGARVLLCVAPCPSGDGIDHSSFGSIQDGGDGGAFGAAEPQPPRTSTACARPARGRTGPPPHTACPMLRGARAGGRPPRSATPRHATPQPRSHVRRIKSVVRTRCAPHLPGPAKTRGKRWKRTRMGLQSPRSLLS